MATRWFKVPTKTISKHGAEGLAPDFGDVEPEAYSMVDMGADRLGIVRAPSGDLDKLAEQPGVVQFLQVPTERLNQATGLNRKTIEWKYALRTQEPE